MIKFIKDSFREYKGLPILLKIAIVFFILLCLFFIGYGIKSLKKVELSPKEIVKSDSLKLILIQNEKNSIDSLLSVDPDSGAELLRAKYGIEISR